MEIIPIKLSVTNCFILKTESQTILIDTGYQEDWELFNKELKRAGIKIVDISFLILTHHHDDHCGLLNNIIRENDKIRIVMSEKAKDLLLVGHNDTTHGGGIINKRVNFILSLSLKQLLVSLKTGHKVDKKDNLKFPSFSVRQQDILVKNETNLKDIGINLDGKIIETPGHSVDSISIVLDNGECFAGDAAARMLQLLGTKYCVIFVMNLDVYYKSWKLIMSNHANKIFPAHGKPFKSNKLLKYIGKNKTKNLVRL